MKIRHFSIALFVALIATNAIAVHEPVEPVDLVDPVLPSSDKRSKEDLERDHKRNELQSEIVRLVIDARLKFISQICHVSGQGDYPYAMKRMRFSLNALLSDVEDTESIFNLFEISSDDADHFGDINDEVGGSLFFYRSGMTAITRHSRALVSVCRRAFSFKRRLTDTYVLGNLPKTGTGFVGIRGSLREIPEGDEKYGR